MVMRIIREHTTRERHHIGYPHNLHAVLQSPISDVTSTVASTHTESDSFFTADCITPTQTGLRIESSMS